MVVTRMIKWAWEILCLLKFDLNRADIQNFEKQVHLKIIFYYPTVKYIGFSLCWTMLFDKFQQLYNV